MGYVEYGFNSLEAIMRRGALGVMTDEQRAEMREHIADRLTTITGRRDDLNKQIHDLKVTLEALDIEHVPREANPKAAIVAEALAAHAKTLEALRKECGLNSQPLDEYGRPLNPSVSRI